MVLPSLEYQASPVTQHSVKPSEVLRDSINTGVPLLPSRNRQQNFDHCGTESPAGARYLHYPMNSAGHILHSGRQYIVGTLNHTGHNSFLHFFRPGWVTKIIIRSSCRSSRDTQRILPHFKNSHIISIQYEKKLSLKGINCSTAKSPADRHLPYLHSCFILMGRPFSTVIFYLRGQSFIRSCRLSDLIHGNISNVFLIESDAHAGICFAYARKQ